MSDAFDKLREESGVIWDTLMTPTDPVFYVGAASCGRSAGAMEVWEAIGDQLEKNRIFKRLLSESVDYEPLGVRKLPE